MPPTVGDGKFRSCLPLDTTLQSADHTHMRTMHTHTHTQCTSLNRKAFCICILFLLSVCVCCPMWVWHLFVLANFKAQLGLTWRSRMHSIQIVECIASCLLYLLFQLLFVTSLPHSCKQSFTLRLNPLFMMFWHRRSPPPPNP